MKRVITTDEIDWAQEFGVYALNRDTRLFENCSGVPGITVEIFKDMDESYVSDMLAARLRDGLDYDYALYDGLHFLVGFAYFN